MSGWMIGDRARLRRAYAASRLADPERLYLVVDVLVKDGGASAIELGGVNWVPGEVAWLDVAAFERVVPVCDRVGKKGGSE